MKKKILNDIKKSRIPKEKTRNISIRVNKELFDKFKIVCKEDDVTMKEAVEHFLRGITKYLD